MSWEKTPLGGLQLFLEHQEDFLPEEVWPGQSNLGIFPPKKRPVATLVRAKLGFCPQEILSELIGFGEKQIRI